MENLKILSMNLGRRFIPIKNKKELVTSYINEEAYDIVMLQGKNLSSNIDFSKLNYEAIGYLNRMAVLYDNELKGFDIKSESPVVSSTIIYNKSPIACINVCCDKISGMKDVFEVCNAYSKSDTIHTIKTRIITGKFPKEVDTNNFCSMFDLEDISTLVGQDSHAKNNREIVNHFFISKNLECVNIHKLVGMTEVSKIGEAYPIEVTLKKVLK